MEKLIPVAARSRAWVCGLLLAGIAGSNPAGLIDVCRLRVCVLSGRGLLVGLITRPVESYRLCCVCVWSRNLANKEALAHGGAVAPLKKVIEKFQKQSWLECSVSSLEPYVMEQTLYKTFISASVATWLPLMTFKTLERRSWNLRRQCFPPAAIPPFPPQSISFK